MGTRTQAGLVLERLLKSMKAWNGHSLRYLLCYNGGEPNAPYDCACCFTWPDDELFQSCRCICHERIEKMATCGDMPLLIRTLTAMGEIPTFPSSADEQQRWHREALERGDSHHHNTNGHFANYPKMVCSICFPGDGPHPRARFDVKTGEPLLSYDTGVSAFEAEAKNNVGSPPHKWKPGRCT